MNKAQLIEKLAEKTELTKTQSEEVLDGVIEIIQKAVAKCGQASAIAPVPHERQRFGLA